MESMNRTNRLYDRIVVITRQPREDVIWNRIVLVTIAVLAILLVHGFTK